MLGKVKTYDKQKKYGFISGDDGIEYYFHENEINLPSKYISAGYTVQFNTADGYPNPKALNVSIL
ncbi:MAG: cold shock domain-containing protein [Butyrivibrio sp.]|nr:cold shock domain-containing protein [Butyrivibrio sp.]